MRWIRFSAADVDDKGNITGVLELDGSKVIVHGA